MSGRKVRVTYECVDGGHGWGETGATNAIVFPKISPVEYYKSHAPGGWEIREIEILEDNN